MRVTVVAVGTVLLGVGCGVSRPAQAAPADAAGAMRAGIHDFGAGAFEAALEEFLEARRQGMDTPALHYDLGATYYRLGRNEESAVEFKSLVSDAKFGDFARYNLGLIARRTGHKTQAREYFSQVAAQAHDTHLQSLARAELRAPPRGPRGWHGFVEAGGGYDDNVALASRDALVTASGVGSKTFSGMAGGGGWLTGSGNEGLRLVGNIYDIQYPDQSAFNLLIAHAGPEYVLPVHSWSLRAGAYANYITLGGNELERLGVFNFRAEHSLGSGRLRLDYRRESVTGGPRYGYLSGWQNQFGVRTNWHAGPVGFMLGYTLTFNRRRDLASGSQFFSVSPVRNQIETELHWAATLRSTFYGRGYYWKSRYHDPNVFLEGRVLQERRRLDDGVVAELGMVYRLTSRAQLTAEYGFRRNGSNIARYAYTSNRYTLAFQYTF